MVVACRAGWEQYLTSPEESNVAILAENSQGLTPGALTFGANELKTLCQPDGMAETEIGLMTNDRWTQLVEQFAELGLIDPGKVRASDVFTTDFINRSSPVD
jgi:hypothetical protein